jgi:hypothetical protein
MRTKCCARPKDSAISYLAIADAIKRELKSIAKILRIHECAAELMAGIKKVKAVNQ